MAAADYMFVKAWYYLTGLQDYHIKDFVKLAAKDGAPEDATHRTKDGQWVRFNQCSPVMQKQMKQAIEEKKI